MRPFTFSLVTLAVLAAQGASGQAHAAGAVSIESVNFTPGGSCSKADTSYLLTPSGDFELRFTNLFAAAASPEPTATSVCEVVVTAQPPPGFALAISGATLEGAARVQNAEASLFHSYAIANSEDNLQDFVNTWDTFADEWIPGRDGNKDRSILQGFIQKFGPGFGRGNVPSEWRGKCGAPTQVTGSLTLTANVEAVGSAEIYADRSLVGGTSSLHWDWELVPCNAPLDGAWRFSYLAPSGRTISGRMGVAGKTGTYRAQGASWTGKLKDLREEAGSVKGTWEALDGTGWVEFTPAGDGRSFQGEWGYEGAAAVGFWNGQKE